MTDRADDRNRAGAAQRVDLPAFAVNAINLASEGLGAEALSASDEFFAPLERMLQDAEAVFIPDKYDDHGKWMDGWETRRRRDGGHDWAVIRLAGRGRIDGFDLDTSHFTGNHAPEARIEACDVQAAPDDATAWTEILPRRKLEPDSRNLAACDDARIWSHIRLHIYPDGGIARLRAYGQPELDPAALTGAEIDLVATLNGGRIVTFSDAHYGTHHRLLAPGRGRNMGDGWETRRKREPGHDWIIVSLGRRGIVSHAVVDTAYFKGNYPDSCSIQAADLGEAGGDLGAAAVEAAAGWETLLGRHKLSADAVHEFRDDLIVLREPITHVRLNIFPDGGVSRLRLFGTLA